MLGVEVVSPSKFTREHSQERSIQTAGGRAPINCACQYVEAILIWGVRRRRDSPDTTTAEHRRRQERTGDTFSQTAPSLTGARRRR